MSDSRIYIPNKVSNIFEKIDTILDCLRLSTDSEYIPYDVSFNNESINFKLVNKIDQNSATISIFKSSESLNGDYYVLIVNYASEGISNEVLKKEIDNLIAFIERNRELTVEQIKSKYYSKINSISRQKRLILILAFIGLKIYYFFAVQIDDFKDRRANSFSNEAFSSAFDSFALDWLIEFGIQIVFLYLILKFIRKNMFKNPFSFNGRIRRSEYVFSMIISSIALLIVNLILPIYEIIWLTYIAYIAYIPLLWFHCAQGAKRCHDRGRSGWYQIIPFYYIILTFGDSDFGDNKYGNSPKGIK
jgi:uncharacterized membrane protein YhaH (DUF805 family)